MSHIIIVVEQPGLEEKGEIQKYDWPDMGVKALDFCIAAAKTETLAFFLCRGGAAGKNPSGSGQKDVRTHLPLAREAFKLLIFYIRHTSS